MYYIFKELDNKIRIIPLAKDKHIYLVLYVDRYSEKDKPFLSDVAIVARTKIVTFSFADSIHFIEELTLFENSNSQNKYFDIVEHMKIVNLRMRLFDTLYISKSETKAIVRIFNNCVTGYSLQGINQYNNFGVSESVLLQYLHYRNIDYKQDYEETSI